MKTYKLSAIPLFLALPLSYGSGTFPIKEAPKVQSNCTIKNTAFQAGEKISFTVYYSVGNMVNVPAGSGSVVTTLDKVNGRPVYKVMAEGKTLPSYEWAYKAKDVYETYIDTETMQPLKFVRNINEGGYKKYQNVSFNKNANTAITNEGVFKVPACVQDVLSAVFYARNVDYNKLRINDRIAFSMFLDNEVFQMQIRFLGRETISTKYGKFKAVKFRPMTIKGNIFKGDEKMTVWVTDDANRIPIRVESPIVVGKVRVDMVGFQGLRSALSSLQKKF